MEMISSVFAKYNKDWIPLVLASYKRLDIVNTKEKGGYDYVFEDAVLNNIVPDAFSGLCGDVGGKTTKGVSCKKKGRKEGDGRCVAHPYGRVVIRVCDHQQQTCDKLRPIPSKIPWSFFSVVADGFPVTTEPVGFRTRRFVSAVHVWSEHMLAVCRDIPVEPNASMVVDNNTEMPAEPLWPSSFLMDMFPKSEALFLNGHRVQRGYTLRDYGVLDGSKSQLKTF